MKVVERPKLTLSLLLPKYWCVWFGFGFLALLVNLLPYRVLVFIGEGVGQLAKLIISKRAKVARRNFELAFPELSEQEIEKLVRRNFDYAGMALIETGMAWFWPDWRVKRHMRVSGKDLILEQEENGRGVLVACGHFLNLEMTARIFSLFALGYGVYRPHSNAAYEFIQHHGRTRKGHKMIDRSDLKGMLKVLKSGNRLWYLPDHDYGANASVFVPFFGVDKASTTAGTGFLIDATKCAVMSGVSVRKGGVYELQISEDFSDQFPRKQPEVAAQVMNQEIERLILKDISAWMWLHRRYKTLPEDHIGPCRYA